MFALRSFRIGTLLGFPLRVNLSFLLLLGVVLVSMGGLRGLAVVLLTFASVVLHELGHALMARRLGVPVKAIDLHFFGGAAMMQGLPRTARDEIAIAAAGPVVSFALAGVGHVLALMTGIEVFALLATTNLVLGLFNLVPALPMDGGRILRAGLSRFMGFRRATEVSVKVARVFAVALGVFALTAKAFHLVVLAIVLWMMSGAERAAARWGGYRRDPAGAEPAGRPELVIPEVLPPGWRTVGAAGVQPRSQPPRIYVWRL